MRSLKWCVGATCLVCCCGGPKPPVSSAAAPNEPASNVPARVSGDAATPVTSTPAANASRGAEQPSEPEPAATADLTGAQSVTAATKAALPKGQEPRQVTYRTSPESLVIEVDGLRLVPTAEPVKRANGSYGVRVAVQVTTTDDSAHHLLAPTNGALSFFSKVLDKRGKVVFEHADQRNGQEALLLTPGMQTELKREWPTDSASGVVWWGQTLHLEVGLWGLGRIEVDRRPLKRLFVVELKAGANPRARILPPDLP